MSKKEAFVDGIDMYYDENEGARGRMGCMIYKVPCAKCGRIVKMKQYSRKMICLCDYCRYEDKSRKKQYIDNLPENFESKEDKRFTNAIEKLQKQVDIVKYAKDINTAKRRKMLYGSIPEAMVAIELLHLGYAIIPQQKIGKYKVDFALPNEKKVVEVDGKIYHVDKYKGDREATIQLSLGLDWKIIHIPAELIEKDIKKLGRIITM